MSAKKIEETLLRRGIVAKVTDNEVSVIRVTTEEAVPDSIKFEIEQLRPAGRRIDFIVSKINSIPVPSSLSRWYKESSKYLK